MGDMADLAVEFGIEQLYGGDNDDCEDEEDEGGGINSRYTRELKTCTRCGAKNLHWGNTDYGWRLFREDGMRHDCVNGKDLDKDNSKPTIGKIVLGRRIVKGVKIDNENGTIIRDWFQLKELIKQHVDKDHYVDVTTTTINDKLAWIVKIKTKKGAIQEEIKFPPRYHPPIPGCESPF